MRRCFAIVTRPLFAALLALAGAMPIQAAAIPPVRYSNGCDAETALKVRQNDAVRELRLPLQACVSLTGARPIVHVAPFRGPHGWVPVLAFLPHGRPKTIVVEVVGGPGGDPFAYLQNPRLLRAQAAPTRDGTAWLVPAYLGTMTRSLHPAPDYAEAVAEIAAHLEFLRARFPAARLVLVGESFGGLVAADAARRAPVDRLVLISPLFRSVRDLVASLDAQGRPYRDVAVNIVARDTGLVQARGQSVPSRAFSLTMAAPALDLRLADLLPAARTPCVDIIYGTADSRIGLADAPPAGRWTPGLSGPAIAVTTVPGGDHDMATASTSPAALVRDALARRCPS